MGGRGGGGAVRRGLPGRRAGRGEGKIGAAGTNDVRGMVGGGEGFEQYLGGINAQQSAAAYDELVTFVRRKPWARPRLLNKNPIGAGFSWFYRWRSDGVPIDAEGLSLAALAGAWMVVTDSCPSVRDSSYARHKLLTDDPMPIIREIDVAHHFVQAGLAVIPTCLVSSDSPDLEILSSAGNIGVEVKTVQTGNGNKIPECVFNRLA